MSDPGLVSALVLVGCVVATGLHEACHYAAARAFGRPATFVVHDCAVYYRANEVGAPELIIAGAPVIAGLGVAAGALAAPVRLPWWTALPWIWGTFAGVRNDFDFRPARTTKAE